jgi:hypothetical protein
MACTCGPGQECQPLKPGCWGYQAPTGTATKRAPYTIRLKSDCQGIPAGTIGTVIETWTHNAKVEFTIGDTFETHYHRTETVYYAEMEAVNYVQA